MNSLKKYKPFPFVTISEWFEKHGRNNLPWRQIYHLPTKEGLYHVWIAEVMLQQTQVDRVIGYYTRFLEKYPTIESLAETTYEELFPYWQGLGYYSRARRMIELAKIVVEKYDGIFPDVFETLRKLPGIGTYTAQALLAFGYNQPMLALDANLQKIFSRYYFGTKHKEKSIRLGGKKEGIYDFDTFASHLQKQVQKENISGRDINNALMDFGALVSTTFDKVDKDVYPLSECRWFQTEGKIEQEKKEERRKKKDGFGNNPGARTSPTKVVGTKKRYKLMVFLHENHQKYWSSHKKHYEPFLIEPTGKDDRKTIQDYFSATFGLEVSVRPSFGNAKLIPGGEILTPGLGLQNPGVLSARLFHAQIQTGVLSLPPFSKVEKGNWVSKNIEIY